MRHPFAGILPAPNTAPLSENADLERVVAGQEKLKQLSPQPTTLMSNRAAEEGN